MNKFYEDQYLNEVDTTIVSSFSEDNKNCVQVAENVFYPHGGGQKGDKGLLSIKDKTYNVIDAEKDPYNDEGVLLITDTEIPEELKGAPVHCLLDWDFRYRQMRLHTAVHFHHCMLEKVAGKTLPHPRISDIQDGFAYNRYETEEITSEMVENANKTFREAIASGAEVKTYPDSEKKGFRWWECLGYKIPCGGTHIKNISEIGDVEIDFSKKKGKATINIKLK